MVEANDKALLDAASRVIDYLFNHDAGAASRSAVKVDELLLDEALKVRSKSKKKKKSQFSMATLWEVLNILTIPSITKAASQCLCERVTHLILTTYHDWSASKRS